ncbi:MAG: hypothetical protein J6C93_00705 [Clostridia bacterium]|nr:hypothetical protein [Clostridia bacterium]
MVKTICKKVYDTETATIVKKVTYSFYGDPNGYETTMYQTPEGFYFLYTYGGENTAYQKEKITRYSAKRAALWVENN